MAALIATSVIGACAKTETVVSPTDIALYSQAYKTSSLSGYCYVEVRQLSLNGSAIRLEDDAIILCNGEPATAAGSGYGTHFTYDSSGFIRLSLLRPKTGTSIHQSVAVTIP